MAGDDADVVGVLLEGQAEHADGLVLQHPERVDDLLDEPVHLAGVDVLDFLEQARNRSRACSAILMNALRSLGKQLPPKPSDGVEEAPADALVHAHAVGDFLHVGAGGLADARRWR